MESYHDNYCEFYNHVFSIYILFIKTYICALIECMHVVWITTQLVVVIISHHYTTHKIKLDWCMIRRSYTPNCYTNLQLECQRR